MLTEGVVVTVVMIEKVPIKTKKRGWNMPAKVHRSKNWLRYNGRGKLFSAPV